MPDSSPEVVEQTTEVTTPTQVAEPVSDVTSAPSTEKAGMLDAVKAALKPTEASPASQEPDPSKLDDPDSKTQEADDGQLSPEELKALSQKTQNRFKGLTSKLSAKDTEITSLKPKAEEYEKISKFVSDAGMTNVEVGQLLTIGALMKKDPAEALKQLAPLVQQLQQSAGDVLPADLQEEVRLGYITEPRARELSRARASERVTREQSDKLRAETTRDAEQRAQQTLVNDTLASVEKWEAKQAERDPDWHLKRKEVSEKVELAILKKTQELGKSWFPTKEEAITLSTDALKDINARFKRFASNPKEITPVTGGASNRSLPKPASMLDVVKNAVAG